MLLTTLGKAAWSQALSTTLESLQGLEPALAGSPDFDYALGLRALQAGRADLALAPLERVILTSPELASAWLDLALAYAKLGQFAQAEALLQEVQLRYAVPPEILARVQLLRESLRAPRPKRWRHSVLIARGYSTNPTQVSGERDLILTPPGLPPSLVLLNDQQPRQDGFTRLQWSVARSSGEQRTDGLQLQVSTQHYDHAREANQDDLGLVWTRSSPQRVGRAWQGMNLVELRHVRQGQQPVLSYVRWGAGIQLALPLLSQAWSCQAGQFNAVSAQHDHRPGYGQAWDASLRASLLCQQGRWQAGASYQVGRVFAAGQRPGGGQVLQALQVPLSYRLNAQQATELTLGLATYRDQSGYSPLIESNARRQNQRSAVGLQHSYSTATSGRWVARVDALNERSNLSIFNNKSFIFSLGWAYEF